MRRLGHQLLPLLLAPLGLVLTGCNRYQQDRALNTLNGSEWKPAIAPRQSWLPEGCVQVPARTGRHMISGREPLLELRDARGTRLAELNPPMPLKGLYWFTLPDVVQLGHDSWLTGVPAHPGWDLADRYLSHLATKRPESAHSIFPPAQTSQQLVSHATASLFHSHAFGPWKEVLRFHPDTGHGWIDTLVPLENGTYLGIARAVFDEHNRRSPLALFARTAHGRLTWSGLAVVDGSGQPFGTETGERQNGYANFRTRKDVEGLLGLRWVAKIPAGLLMAGHRSVLLLHPEDGRPLKQMDICDERASIQACQPMPDGRVMLVVRGWSNASQAHKLIRTLDSPSRKLLGNWILSRELDAHGLPPTWGLILDPATGQLTPLPLPPLAEKDLFRVLLQVTPDGKPRILEGPGDEKW